MNQKLINKKVLIVDDNEDVLFFLEFLLKTCFGSVTGVKSPIQAVLVAENEAFDFVISDYRMPYMNGVQLIRRLRQTHLNHAIPALVITAQPSVDDLTEDLPSDCKYLRKPFTKDQIVGLISHQ